MKKLHELLGQHLCEGDVGVEIECEGRGIREISNKYWRTEPDGSLRGAYPESAAEFVMKQPVTLAQLSPALDMLIEEQADAEFKFSFRTSAHVHVNVQTLTEPEMLAFLYLCLLVEEPLMNFCGESRKGNRFCLRYADAEGYDKTLDNLFEKGYHAIHRLDGNRIRYAAINIHAMQKYGSIEFRGMRGNMDKEVLTTWCETLIHLREYARALGSPLAVFNRYIATPLPEFIASALGKHSDKLDYNSKFEDVERSFSLTIDLPHIFKARKKVDPRKAVPIPGLPFARRLDNIRANDVLANTDKLYAEWVERNPETTQIERLAMYMELFKDISERP